jgi:hypothetical protein
MGGFMKYTEMGSGSVTHISIFIKIQKLMGDRKEIAEAYFRKPG